MPLAEKNRSFWDKWTEPDCPKLNQNEPADVCIVGAGIAGLSTAYELLQRGLSVIVLDRKLQDGQTHRTTGHLTDYCDDHYFEMEHLHGRENASLIAESHAAAIDRTENIINTEQIACDFARVPGYLFLDPEKNELFLRRELAAAHRSGVKCNFINSGPHSLGPCIHYPNQAQFNAGKYMQALTRIILKKGGRIFTGAHVVKVKSHSAKSAEVQTRSGYKVSAHAVVVATNVPINDRVLVQTKIYAYRTYVLAFEIPDECFKPSLFWDTGDPYHYIRCAKDHSKTILLIGGEDHRTGQNPPISPFRRLEAWAKEFFPFLGKISYRWSGQIIEPVDGVAFIGRNPADGDNIYIHTGDSGQGLTHAVIGGLLISDLITGKKNAWEELYNPRRRTMRSIPVYVEENLNQIYQYKKWLTRGPKKICPHLGGVLCWNSEEQTWDCPVHGSRFDKEGNVIEGPANSNLKRAA